jgi:hypothetical protein
VDLPLECIIHEPLTLVDGMERLVPASDSDDDFVRVGGPGEWLGLLIVLGGKRLIAAWRSTTEWTTPRLTRRFGSPSEEPRAVDLVALHGCFEICIFVSIRLPPEGVRGAKQRGN